MIPGGFKSNDFASADPKGLADAFFVSADSKGVTSVDTGPLDSAGSRKTVTPTNGPGLGSTRAAGEALGLSLSSDRKSTRLNSSHVKISYAVFCLKKKKK